MTTIGERLKELRSKNGYSQQFVADQIGVERTTYVKWENGSSRPTKKIPELASLYGVTTDYILGNDGTNVPVIYNTDSQKKQAALKEERAQQAYDILMQLPSKMQKAALAQLRALAELNKKL